MDLLEGISLHAVNGDLYRNIVSLRVSEDLLDDLSDDPAKREVARRCEMDSKPPLYSTRDGVIHRPFDEAEWFNAIRYPFQHWTQSRFSDGRFGVWYGSDKLATTVHETVHHWRAGLLADAGWADIDGVAIERKVYRVRCHAGLLDFRPAASEEPDLVAPDDYSYTQALGRRLHSEGHPGLINRSARCDGDVYALFNESRLSDPRAHCFLTYTVDGGRVIVERTPGSRYMAVGSTRR